MEIYGDRTSMDGALMEEMLAQTASVKEYLEVSGIQQRLRRGRRW